MPSTKEDLLDSSLAPSLFAVDLALPLREGYVLVKVEARLLSDLLLFCINFAIRMRHFTSSIWAPWVEVVVQSQKRCPYYWVPGNHMVKRDGKRWQ